MKSFKMNASGNLLSIYTDSIAFNAEKLRYELWLSPLDVASIKASITPAPDVVYTIVVIEGRGYYKVNADVVEVGGSCLLILDDPLPMMDLDPDPDLVLVSRSELNAVLDRMRVKTIKSLVAAWEINEWKEGIERSVRGKL